METLLKRKKSVITILLALILTLALVIGMIPKEAFAAVDGSSRNMYTDVFKSSSTENSGRVWSDKSVYENEQYVSGHRFDLKSGENFNVVYSTMGSSEKVTGQSKVPLDVVFILDISGSMGGEDNSDRIINATKAMDSSMKTILNDNPQSRVGVATFSNGGSILMPLSHYEPKLGSSSFISSDGEKITVKYKGSPLRGISREVTGGTNTQSGFDAGMKMLVNEKTTTANVNGKTVKRAPVVVMLSDGEPTYSCHDSSWWNPANYKTQGPGTTARYGNGMLAMMNAAYNKQQISKNYGVEGTALAAKVYTVGLTVSDQDLAKITLNPKAELDGAITGLGKDIKDAWGKYSAGGSPSIEVRAKSDSDKWCDYSNTTYTAKHPSANDITDLKYNDQYYDAANSSELEKVFQSIVSDISTSVPDYPTDIKGNSAAASGFVTYTDPIGKYMEVKEIKAVIHDGKKFDLAKVDDTHYKGKGTIKDPITGADVDLGNLTVEVQRSASGSETLIAKIPAAAIPLKINEVKIGNNGGVLSNTCTSDPSPLNIVYSVGMKAGVEKLEGVSPEYIAENTENGKVNFYSNLFTGQTNAEGKTVGDAYTSFTPAADNPNYYFQQNAVVYRDKGLTKPVKTTESFDPAATYYIGTPYYNGVAEQSSLVERTGSRYIEAQKAGYLVDEGGNWALKAGVPRNYHVQKDLSSVKNNNTTKTAEMLYAGKVFKTGYNISKIEFRHGNNGKVQVEARKDLVIKKKVTTEAGVKAPDRAFSFDVTMPSLSGDTVKAVLTSGGADTEQSLVFDGNGKTTVRLKDGESIRLKGVMGDYTVVEQDPGKGFTVAPAEAKGTIGTVEDEVAEFTNDYKVTPLDVDQTEFGFPMSKTINGRNFKADDRFVFQITGPEGAMPEKKEAVIDGNTVKGQSVAEVDFGKFRFTKPGTYEYMINESFGNKDDIAGIKYDSTRYKLIVTVQDDGHGNLSILDSKVKKSIDADNWTEVGDKKMSFTNVYSAESTKVNFTGKKVLENKSLNDLSRSFEFRVKAITKDAPMPAGLSVNGTVPADKTYGTIAFTDVEFTQADIGKTYEYSVTEIQPTADGEYKSDALSGAVGNPDKDENWVYKGITFDHSVKRITVEVKSEDIDGKSYVKATVTGNDFEFRNVYNAEKEYSFTNTEGGEPGIKKISGRNFKKGDEFVFDVTSEVSSGTISKEAALPEKVTIRPETGKEHGFDFGNVKFTEADAGKTFTYTFKERKGDLGGITYDEAVRTITLKVRDKNDGTLVIERQGDKLEWNNSYRSEWKYDGFELTGLKALEGKKVEPGTFTFTVKGLDGAPLDGGTAMNDNTVMVTNGLMNSVFMDKERAFYILDHQKYTMEDLGGAASKTFVYEIREVIPEPEQPGMKYDRSVYRVAVKVADDQNGTINVSYGDLTFTKLNPKTGEFEPAEFTEFKNVYHPEEQNIIPFKVNGESLLYKELKGPRKEELKADEFKFTFELKNADPSNGVEIVNEGAAGNKAPESGKANIGEVSFDKSKITFKEPGSYVFTIKETKPETAGIKNTTPEIEITYNVKDVEGKLVAEPSFTGNVKDGIFVNEYSTAGKVDGKTDLVVEKILEGRTDGKWKPEDSFTFRLEPADPATGDAVNKGAVKIVKGEIVIDESTPGHKASFGDIELTRPGEYTFRVSEDITGLQPGVHPDGKDRLVKVKAVDNGDGTMTVTSQIMAGDSVPLSANDLVFTNTYKPDEATLSGEANLSVRKQLDGREWTDGDAFKFTLTGGDEKTTAAIGKDVILGNDQTATSITITNKSINQTEHFSDVVFKKEGTYVFKVTESRPDAPNVSYDKTDRKITVNVELKADGSLAAKVDKSKSDELTFINTYKPTPQKLDGKTNLSVTKEINGREWLENESFTFELTAVNDAAKKVLGKPETVKVNGTDKTAHFSDLTFTEKGTYEFEVTEKVPEGTVNGGQGLTYDIIARTVIVNVKDNLDGTLDVTKNDKLSDELSFRNTYTPEPLTYSGETNLKVKKIIDGRKWVPGDRFSFTLDYDRNDAATEEAFMKGYFDLPDVRNIEIAYKEGTDELAYGSHFGDIVFRKAGEYKFTIGEHKGDLGGMTYDRKLKTITVKVTDDGKGKLTASSNDESVFTNRYHADPVVFPAEGKGDLQVTKVFKGRDWKDTDEFRFVLEPIRTYDPGSFELGSTECTVKGSDINKVASFGDIKFFKTSPERGYEFSIREIIPDGGKAGIKYDDNVKRVAIKVVDDNKGKLHAYVIDKYTNSLVFTNTYEPSPLVIIPTQDPSGQDGTIGIRLAKILKGRDWKEGDSFSFRIEGLDGAPAPSKTECTVTGADQQFDFGILRINAADMDGAEKKVFRYKVTEIVPEKPLPGVEYTKEPVIFEVLVTDNGKGYLIAGDGSPDSSLVTTVPGGANKADFVNVYTPAQTELDGSKNLKVTKDFTGRADNKWNDSDKFTFQLTVSDPDTNAAKRAGHIILPDNASGITITAKDSAKEKAFGNIIFKKAGTYKFDIGEINQNIAGVTYAKVQHITVEVTDNTDGKLVATVKDGTQLKPFSNVYKTGTATLSGKDHLNVEKKIDGREWKAGDSFTFTLSSNNAATDKGITDKEIIMPENNEITITIDDKTEGHIKNFGDIVFKNSGEFEFKVTENLPDGVKAGADGKAKVKGMIYNTAPKIVKVSVSDLGDGTLKASTDTDKLVFVNKYEHTNAELDGSKDLVVRKQLEGRNWKDTDQFEFYMTANNELAQKVKLPADITIRESSETGTEYNKRVGHFGNIEFTEPGVYEFFIHEKVPADKIPGVLYDTTPRKVTVTVTDNMDGTMTAEAEPAEFLFINRYNPAPCKISGVEKLKVSKNLTGRKWVPGDSFKFTMTPDEKTASLNTPAHTAFRLPDNANGIYLTYDAGIDKEEYSVAHNGNFGNIEFFEKGWYTFYIREEAGTLSNIHYAPTVHSIVIAVIDNSDTGRLEAYVQNVFTKEPGQDIYNSTSYYEENKNTLPFQNLYIPDEAVLDGTSNLRIEKELIGREWKPGDKFTFKLKPASPYYGTEVEYTGPTEITIEYNPEGDYTASFGDLKFSRAGTYEFRIEEENGGIPGMSYAGYKMVTVKVTDDLHGQLHAEIKGDKISKFKNAYDASDAVLEGETNLQVEKVFDGREWQAGDSFTFNLAPKNSATKQAVKDGIVVMGNDKVTIDKAGQTANFGNIRFTKTGSYVFEVSETIPADAPSYVEYDKSRKTIFVEVTDDLNGKLVAELSDTDVKSVFNNRYSPEPAVLEGKADLEVQKILKGREWTDGDTFLFEMKGYDDLTDAAVKAGDIEVPSNFDEISVTESTKDGKASFGNITFHKAGTYTFRVAEKKSTIKAVTYDEVGRIVKVVVKDDLQGRLSIGSVSIKADQSYKGTDKDNLIFKNEYKRSPAVLEGEKNLKVEKTLKGREWKAGDSFSFTLAADTTHEATRAAVEKGNIILPGNADGITITDADAPSYTDAFGDITFKAPGTFKFIVSETPSASAADKGLTYDTEKYEVTVNVTDNLDGTMDVKADKNVYAFENLYTPDDAILEGDTNLKVKKTFKGKEWRAEAFTFVLEPAADYGNDVINAKQEITMNIADVFKTGVIADGMDIVSEAEKSFGDITFKKAGTYQFKVTERKGDTPGIDYNTENVKARIDVRVSDDSNGKLKAEILDSSDTLVFNNEYKPEPAVLSGDTAVRADKQLTGREITDNDKWHFTITAAEGSAKNTPLPDKQRIVNNGENIVFGAIKYTKPGEYRYVIREDNEKLPGITNDTGVVNVTVKVGYDQGRGNLVPEVFYEKADGSATSEGSTFVNTYNADPAVLSGDTYLKVEKILNDRPGNKWTANDKYEFHLDLDTSDKFTNDNKDSVSFESSGKVVKVDKDSHKGAFGKVTFSKPGIYKLKITEIDTKVPGVQYDSDKEKSVIVTVTDNLDGTMSVKTDGTEKGYRFINKYTTEPAVVDGSENLNISKIFKGRNWKDTDVFKFELKPTGDTAESMYVRNGEQTIKMDHDLAADGVVSGEDNNVTTKVQKAFGDITFGHTGTYTFEISEVKGDIDKVNYDDSKIKVTVKVTDPGEGKLAAEVTTEPSGEIIFTNEYTPAPIEIGGKDPGEDPGDPDTPDEKNENAYLPLMAQKVLEGREMTADDKWTFVLDGEGNAPMPAENEVTNSMNDIRFGTIKYSQTGTFKYTITEKNADKNGMTTDRTVLNVTVKVTYDKDEGRFKPEVTYENGRTEQNGLTFKKFINEYDAQPLELSGNTYLKVMKELNGRAWNGKDKFAFKLAPAEDYGSDIQMPESAEAVITSATKDHTAAFGDIKINKAGTYRFSISEIVPEGAKDNVYQGITYDKDTETVEIVVKDNNKGSLVVANQPQKTAYTFENSYGTDAAVLDGAANLNITKVFKGKKWTDEEFSFMIEPTGDTVGNDNVIMPAEKITVKGDKAVTEGSGVDVSNKVSKAFGDIQFKASGVYTFRISEVAPEDKGNVNYDTHTVDITVTVEDKESEGHLTATAGQITEGSMTFINVYKPDPAEIGGKDPGEDPGDPDTPDDNDKNAYLPLMAKKALTGRDMTDSDKWTFTLKGINGAPMPGAAEAENENGLVRFGLIRFDKEGTFKYEITETSGKIAGVTNDTGKIGAEVRITYNTEEGRFIPHVTYTREGQDGVYKTFTNVYNAAPADVPASVFGNMKKTVEATDGNSYVMKGGEFTFELAPVNDIAGDPVTEPVTSTNDAKGNISFLSGKTYTVPGNYEYTVKEKTGTVPGIGYSDMVYKIRVEVEDNKTSGKLETRAEIFKIVNGKEVSYDGNITFRNTYDPEAATAVFSGIKNLEVLHGNKDIADGDFSFRIEAEKGAPLPEKTEVKNTGGSFVFDTVTFTKPGVYKYTISEVNGGAGGYIYDGSRVNVEVEVTDAEGVLKAVTKVNGSENGKIEFTNKYDPDPAVLSGETALRLTKELTGRDLRDGEFEFTVKDSSGNELKTVTNDAEGNVVFEGISINEPGEHRFDIAEQPGITGGVTYDTSTYTAVVNVTDKAGKLTVDQIRYMKKGEEAEPVFANAYAPAGTGDADISAVKILNGGKLEKGQFEFELADKDGKVLQTVSNDARGNITFGHMTFEKEDIYEFVITEKKGNDRSIEYDDSRYTVKVIVTDNENGSFDTEVKIQKDGADVDGITFVNTDKGSGNGTKTGDDSNMNLLLMLMLIAGTGIGIGAVKRKISAK